MSRVDRSEDEDAGSLDPLARKLLDLDEAIARQSGSRAPDQTAAFDTPRNTSDPTHVPRSQEPGSPISLGNRDSSQDSSPDEFAEQCLHWIEAIRVTSPDILEDAFTSTGKRVAPDTEVTGSGVSAIDLDELPANIGRFLLVRRLGQGGYGIVFLARDPTLHRDVALKVPRPEVLLTPDLRRRFLREAEAAAALDHRHIVPVYEAGSAGPICYIASAYCPGSSLSEWLHEQEQVMSPRLAAEVVAALADAVQHAHDRRVLHRDIKPGNVLIERFDDASNQDLVESVRLTDFGLARITAESSEQTMSAGIVGTPAYMAPEQAANRREDVGVATDVYGLGATLYHLLTGRPPIVGSSQIETLSAILKVEPTEPRQVRPEIPRDLSAICMKCLEKDHSRRYTAAADLRNDLERFLRGEQVVARPVGQLQRASKWCQRNPAVAITGATAAAAVLVAMIVAFAGWWSTSRALRREKAALVEADRAYQETKEAVDYYVTISENRLLNAPGQTPLRKELLSGALNYYLGFVERHEHDASAADELRKAHIYIADVYEDLGDVRAAWNAYQKAMELLDRQLASGADTQKVKLNQGMVHRKLAKLKRRLNELPEALAHANKSIELHGGLIELGFELDKNHYELAQALSGKAGILHSMGQLPEAIELYQEGESLIEALLTTSEDNPDLQLRLAQLSGNRSIMLRTLGRVGEAKPLLASSAEIYEQLVTDYPEAAIYQENLGKAYANLSLHASMERDYESTVMQLSKATEIFDRLATAHPQVTKYHLLRASTRKEAGGLLGDLDQLERSEQLLRETVAILEKVLDDSPKLAIRELTDTRLLLGMCIAKSGDNARAQPILDAATQLLEQQWASTPRDFLTCMGLARASETQAKLCLSRGEVDEAHVWLDKGQDVLQPLREAMPANQQIKASLADNHACRAELYEGLGEYEQALQVRQLALDLALAEQQNQRKLELAVTLALNGEFSEAERQLAEAESEVGAQLRERAALARAHAMLAKCYAQTKPPNEAADDVGRASPWAERVEAHVARAMASVRDMAELGLLDESRRDFLLHEDYSALWGLSAFEEFVPGGGR